MLSLSFVWMEKISLKNTLKNMVLNIVEGLGSTVEKLKRSYYPSRLYNRFKNKC